jgi:Fe-S cluster assembly scaffold protein SufB
VSSERVLSGGKAINFQHYAQAAVMDDLPLVNLESLGGGDSKTLSEVGVILNDGQRSGSFVVRNAHTLCSYTHVEGLEVLPIHQALEKYDWLREKYFWKLVKQEADEITRHVAAQAQPQGFFIRVQPGVKVELPYQAGLYMADANSAQTLHNVVIVEDGAELTLITGCATHQAVDEGLHLAVSEFYVGKNAVLTNNMVHAWGPKVTVRPKAGTAVAAGGQFNSNYISLRPAADIITNPKTWLNGEGASARFQSIILGSPGSFIQSGGEIYLNGLNTSTELIHRAVCTGGQILQEGLLVGSNACRAHIDCSGMLLNAGDQGFIQSNPGLRALDPDAQMSHEASIGKIAPDQVEYLMSRGIEERDAISMIIRGFLQADIEGLGSELDARIAEIANLAGSGEG